MKRSHQTRDHLVEFNGYWVPGECEIKRMPLATRNEHARDRFIAFRDDTHTYYIKGKANYISCTTFIGTYFEKFDADRTIDRWLNDRSFPHGRTTHARYVPLCYDKTGGRCSDAAIREAILQHWDQNRDRAAELGTAMHNNIEFFYNKLPVDQTVAGRPEYGYFQQYHRDVITARRKWRMLRTEMMVWDDKARVCGSIDAMYVDERVPPSDDDDWRTGEKRIPVHLVDWKRSKKIQMRAFGNKTGYGPCGSLPCTNHSKYTIQLNIYRKILETYYNVVVESMELAVFHPDNEGYNLYPVQKLDDVVTAMFAERTNSLQDDTCTPKKRCT